MRKCIGPKLQCMGGMKKGVNSEPNYRIYHQSESGLGAVIKRLELHTQNLSSNLGKGEKNGRQ